MLNEAWRTGSFWLLTAVSIGTLSVIYVVKRTRESLDLTLRVTRSDVLGSSVEQVLSKDPAVLRGDIKAGQWCLRTPFFRGLEYCWPRCLADLPGGIRALLVGGGGRSGGRMMIKYISESLGCPRLFETVP